LQEGKKKAVLAYFKILPLNMFGQTGKIHE